VAANSLLLARAERFRLRDVAIAERVCRAGADEERRAVPPTSRNNDDTAGTLARSTTTAMHLRAAAQRLRGTDAHVQRCFAGTQRHVALATQAWRRRKSQFTRLL
jgi:hypothetical protein